MFSYVFHVVALVFKFFKKLHSYVILIDTFVINT
jgi:hypothetical protein